nr:unnamed protein product [Spirometra erinaceieuropaei]
MTATAPIPHSSLLTGSDSGWGAGVGRESEVDDSAHFLLTINNLTRLKLSRSVLTMADKMCGPSTEEGRGGVSGEKEEVEDKEEEEEGAEEDEEEKEEEEEGEEE